ncbi:hypothetical protein Hanom_Chr11g01059481 [Helianthus anomalus]
MYIYFSLWRTLRYETSGHVLWNGFLLVNALLKLKNLVVLLRLDYIVLTEPTLASEFGLGVSQETMPSQEENFQTDNLSQDQAQILHCLNQPKVRQIVIEVKALPKNLISLLSPGHKCWIKKMNKFVS